MTQRDLLIKKMQLLKSVLKPKYHLMLENITTTAIAAIDEEVSEQKRLHEGYFGSIISGKPRYFRSTSMRPGTAYKVSSSFSESIPEGENYIEMPHEYLVDIKSKHQ